MSNVVENTADLRLLNIAVVLKVVLQLDVRRI